MKTFVYIKHSNNDKKTLENRELMWHFKCFTLHNFYYGVLSAFHYMHVILINVRRIYVCIWREECMPMCLQSHLLSFSCDYLPTSLPKNNIYCSLVNIRQINFRYWNNMSMKSVWLNSIKPTETDIVYTTDASLVSKFS